MRDGRYVDTVDAQEVAIDQIISMMVGRTILRVGAGSAGASNRRDCAGGEGI
jgi:ABC-type sugar transport system ATPase subunit